MPENKEDENNEEQIKSRFKGYICLGLTCIVTTLIFFAGNSIINYLAGNQKFDSVVTQLNKTSKEHNEESYLPPQVKPEARVILRDWNDPQDRMYLMNEHLKDVRIHQDKKSPTGVYVPISFDDALKELDYMLPPEAKRDIKNCTIGDMLSYHDGFGTWIRNNWCLWRGGALADDMKRLGFTHPDDMSGAIFDSYWLKVHGKPIEIKAQSKKYQKYWNMVKQMTKEGSSKGTNKEN